MIAIAGTLAFLAFVLILLYADSRRRKKHAH